MAKWCPDASSEGYCCATVADHHRRHGHELGHQDGRRWGGIRHALSSMAQMSMATTPDQGRQTRVQKTSLGRLGQQSAGPANSAVTPSEVA